MSQTESFDDTHAITLGGTGPGASTRVLRPGEIIGGLYRLKSLLGKGGMGYVFRAEQTTTKRDYALKMLAPEQLNVASRRRFEDEGRAIARLNHSSIVKVYDMGLDAGDCPYYVMDLLDGTSLSDYIARKKDIDLDQCLEIFGQLASALGYAHGKGIIHRDVKPSNIILLDEGSQRRRAKIVDFGIAKLLHSANLSSQSHTATGAVFGSPLYMSPEQSMGSAVDHRSDIYSLGCTFFEMLCGESPYRGHNAMEVVMMHQEEPIPSILDRRRGKHLPEEVDLLVAKMLAKRPDSRYQSMDQVLHDLERLKHGKTIGTVHTSGRSTGGSQPAEASADGHDRHSGPPTALLFTLGVLASLVVGGGLLWVLNQHDSRHQKFDAITGADDKRFTMDQFEVPRSFMLENAWAAYDKCGKIKSKIVTVNGTEQRRFVFPNSSIGRILGSGLVPVEATGIVYTSPKKLLQLEIGQGVSRAVLSRPAIIERIDSGEFSGLGIVGNGTTDVSSQFSSMPKPSDSVLHLLKVASAWPNLQFIKLESVPITREILEVINGCNHLVSFEFDKPVTNCQDLAGQPFFRRLSTLRLSGVDHIQVVCDQLADSPNLQTVRFTDCNIQGDELLKLRGCPELHRLELQETDFAKLVPVVTRLTRLQEVFFIDTVLNQEQIKSIAACPNIRQLFLSKGAYSGEERERCSGPKVSFYTD